MRGRKARPTQLKILAGNPGKRALNHDEPKPASGIPTCPKWLPKYAKQEWAYAVEQLAVMGVLTMADAGAVARYCLGMAAIRQLIEESEKDKVAPNAGQLKILLAETRAAGSLLGLDPSSRSRMTVAKSSEEKNGFDAFLSEAN